MNRDYLYRTIATSNGTIIVYANVYDAAELNVTEDRPKTIKVTNNYSGKTCIVRLMRGVLP